eukprot:TRINITY_DN1524_c0_g1_i1.p1 TRINITY_DN1524_c0_g1~~TRINITY_DN1524_c0_g1_i1.p1  ORF type:complete len:150 (-),score=24.10 TRINITY_DN1524_c0_g1_i1:8-457(-)
MMRFTENKFSQDFVSTIGVDFKIRDIVTEDEKKIKLTVWDTAGQERFRTIINGFFRGAQGVIIVYDVTDVNSFENVPSWLKDVPSNVAKLLVGNKADLKNRQVDFETANAFAKKLGIDYVETSARNEEMNNVDKMFQLITKNILSKSVY